MSEQENTADTPVAEEAAAPFVLDEAAQNIILRHTMLSAGAGLIPLPLADMAAITAFNLKMIRDLAQHYGVEFREDLAKSAIASLLTAVATPALAIGPVFSLLKAVPGAGHLLGGLAVPGVGGGLTYATGRVFARHFESGGSFLTFDASRFKSMFKREFKDGKEAAASAEAKDSSAEAPQAAAG